MPASPGRSLLLRVNTAGTTFVTAGGLRTKQVKRSTDKVDVTTADSAGRWRELLPGAAVQSLTFTASDWSEHWPAATGAEAAERWRRRPRLDPEDAEQFARDVEEGRRMLLPPRDHWAE